MFQDQLRFRVLDDVPVRVGDDVGGPAGALDDDAGDALLEPVLDDADGVLAALEQQRHDWYAEALNKEQNCSKQENYLLI